MKLALPESVLDVVARRFVNQYQNWVVGDGVWPLSLPLGCPSQRDVLQHPANVRAWIEHWRNWVLPGEIVWENRKWSLAGSQSIPISLCFTSPDDVAAAIGETHRWTTAVKRYAKLCQHWPHIGAVVKNRLGVLVDYDDVDFDRLVHLLIWFERNRSTQLYLRQLPVEGIHTKWLEQRIGLVTIMLKAILESVDTDDLYNLCGLRRPPPRIRMLVLCPTLRQVTGGLRDIEAPIEELALLPISPSTLVLVENRDTGVALPDCPGTVALVKLGNAVTVIEQLPWIRNRRGVYWGDIDTHGFFILNQARRIVSDLRSVMMDEATLLDHRNLWSDETQQSADVNLECLTANEATVYRGLREGTWGHLIRLEQERIPWSYALAALNEALLAVEPLCDGH